MYNAYGERHLAYTRHAVATLDTESRTGASVLAQTIFEGIPADAALVAVVLAQTDSQDTPTGHDVRLVYEHDSFALCLAGASIPEVTMTAQVSTTTVTTATVQEG